MKIIRRSRQRKPWFTFQRTIVEVGRRTHSEYFKTGVRDQVLAFNRKEAHTTQNTYPDSLSSHTKKPISVEAYQNGVNTVER